MHIFLDSSVLLAFCLSKKGASALILDFCRQGKLKGYISHKVVFEVQNNNMKDNNALGKLRFDTVLKQGFLTIVPDGTEEELTRAHEAFDNPKDAPILAAAKQTHNVTFIISLDKGFFTKEVQAYVQPIAIRKPGDFINTFRAALA